ncbi:Ultraviolet-B receptor UVR8 [Forsythia ovata]|uniref:Ultraviolet-B receptor UVR8 n=1 Tax=Forsythia ovata TaxID=205694 RepID=A0ABD1RMJ6_9LAMI
MIDAVAEHTAAVTKDGALYSTGWDRYGNLGLIPEKFSIVEISGGSRHTMALTNDGMFYGWGWNKFGQVGVVDNVDHCSQVLFKFSHDQKGVHVSCGWRHTLVH